MLADHFVARLNERFGSAKRLSAEARRLLERHDWPGNVRELLHAIEGAMVVCEGLEIRPEHLPAAVRAAEGSAVDPQRVADTGGHASLQTLESLERTHIELALRTTAGHRSQTAKLLGISERNLYRKLREYELA